MELVIGHIRRPGHLAVLVNQKTSEFSFDSGEYSLAELSQLYEVKELPFNSLKSGDCQRSGQMTDSWDYLSRVSDWNEETLFHLLVVLIETLPVYSKLEQTPPTLDFSDAPAQFQPTAAHPRAYKGTRDRRPKAKSLPTMDIRPHTCDRRSLVMILSRLSEYWVAAAEALSRVGYDTRVLFSETGEPLFKSEPYLLINHPGYYLDCNTKLPEHFILYLLPLLKGAKWPMVMSRLSMFWGLSLNDQKELLVAVSRLLSLQPKETTLEWSELISTQPPNLRTAFTSLLIESGIYEIEPGKGATSALEKFYKQTNEDNYAQRLIALFRGLFVGLDYNYLLAGFDLANRYCPDYAFKNRPRPCRDFSFETIEGFYEYIKEAEPAPYESFPLTIWQACGTFPGFTKVLEKTNWRNFRPRAAYDLLCCLLYSCEDIVSDEERNEKWKYISSQMETVESLICRVDDKYQDKLISCLDQFFYAWDNPQTLNRIIPVAYQLLERLSRPPFQKTTYTEVIIGDFIYAFDGDLCDLFLNAPDSAFLNLEKFCRSKNNAGLLEVGNYAALWTSRGFPGSTGFLLNCFIHFSQKYCTAMKSLGVLRRHLRFFVFKEFCAHPLMQTPVESLPTKELMELIESFLGPSISNPIPKKLNEYLSGGGQLSEERLKKYRDRMMVSLNLTRLDILDNMIDQTLRDELPLDREVANWKHTMQFVNILDNNRRPFKKFLKSYLRGETDYLVKHPKTKAWIEKHPNLNLARWMTGVQYSKTLDGHGLVTIELERDHLEALKMGTYVGSCLGLGGGFEFSAAAAVLDINKQIIYARDKDGNVIGRQLLALTEDEKMVCFNVYPSGVDDDILNLFREYDRKIAAAVSVKIYKEDDENEEGYTIDNVMSEDWWDDGYWDLNAPIGLGT